MSGEATANLEHFLQPAGTFDLIRLGRDHDGGYLVDRRDVLASTALISLGINNDWSFEDDFLTFNPVPLDAYDGSVSPSVYAKRIVKDAVAGHGQELVRNAKALAGHRRFFTDGRRHHRLMVGFQSAPGMTTLHEIFDTKSNSGDRVFLKVDIEGWEYRLLDDIVKYADRISALAIEFHDFDLHAARVRDFIAATNLAVAHVHCNNYCPVSDTGTPLAIEVTLTSQVPISTAAAVFPHPLDQANCIKLPEIPITFN